MKKFLKIIDKNNLILDVLDDYSKICYVMKNNTTNVICICRSLNDIKFNSFGLKINNQIYSLDSEINGYPICHIIEIDEEEYSYLKSIIDKEIMLNLENSEEESGLDSSSAQVFVEDSYENYIKSNDLSTLNLTKDLKIKSLRNSCRKAIMEGFDLEINGIVQHFDLNTEDQLNLNALRYQILAAMDRDYFAYKSKDNSFQYYNKNEINMIIEKADSHILYHRAYFNSLKQYVESLSEFNAINMIEYGQSIPEEFKSSILTDIEYK